MWWVWRNEAGGGFGCCGLGGGYVGQVVMDLVVGFAIFPICGGRGFPWWWWLMWVCGVVVVVGRGQGAWWWLTWVCLIIF